MGLKQYSYIPFVVLGTYTSWLYLRFFQQQPDSQHKGDSSDDFRFSGFFPSILAVVLDPIGILCSTVFRLRHQPVETKAPFAGAAQYSLGSDNADANRRRCALCARRGRLHMHAWTHKGLHAHALPCSNPAHMHTSICTCMRLIVPVVVPRTLLTVVLCHAHANMRAHDLAAGCIAAARIVPACCPLRPCARSAGRQPGLGRSHAVYQGACSWRTDRWWAWRAVWLSGDACLAG